VGDVGVAYLAAFPLNGPLQGPPPPSVVDQAGAAIWRTIRFPAILRVGSLL
jgi:hypothetical protein